MVKSAHIQRIVDPSAAESSRRQPKMGCAAAAKKNQRTTSRNCQQPPLPLFFCGLRLH